MLVLDTSPLTRFGMSFRIYVINFAYRKTRWFLLFLTDTKSLVMLLHELFMCIIYCLWISITCAIYSSYPLRLEVSGNG
jgi:hypothetical protein